MPRENFGTKLLRDPTTTLGHGTDVGNNDDDICMSNVRFSSQLTLVLHLSAEENIGTLWTTK